MSVSSGHLPTGTHGLIWCALTLNQALHRLLYEVGQCMPYLA